MPVSSRGNCFDYLGFLTIGRGGPLNMGWAWYPTGLFYGVVVVCCMEASEDVHYEKMEASLSGFDA
jgi:hypothetical protein